MRLDWRQGLLSPYRDPALGDDTASLQARACNARLTRPAQAPRLRLVAIMCGHTFRGVH